MEGWTSLADYVGRMKPGQEAIYVLVGDDLEMLAGRRSWRASAPAASRCCCSPTRSTPSGRNASAVRGQADRSVTQGASDLALIPLLDDKKDEKPESTEAVTNFIAFVKLTLGDAVSDVRASDRLTDSAVCLVAPEGGPDRSLEKLLAGSGRAGPTAKPILEINPRHGVVASLAALGDGDNAFKEDAAHLLLDEARVLEGDRPADAKAFSARLARLLGRGLRNAGN